MATVINFHNIEMKGWAVCQFCMPSEAIDCEECLGTDRDPMPWSELFNDYRERYSSGHA